MNARAILPLESGREVAAYLLPKYVADEFDRMASSNRNNARLAWGPLSSANSVLIRTRSKLIQISIAEFVSEGYAVDCSKMVDFSENNARTRFLLNN